MIDSLPPLNALRAFKAIAQSGGVRAASEILNVTQSSVSRHLSVIEDHLQLKLFHREGRGLVLTDAGRDYLLRITPAFEAIGDATAAIKRRSRRVTITLSAPLTLIANWLLPRLPGFLAENKDMDFRLVDKMTLKPADDEIDCAIEYRFQPAPEFTSTLLFADEIAPVLAPAHFNVAKIKTLEDLRGITLVDTARRHLSWQSILHGKLWFDQQPMLTVNHSVHALEAARLGLGVALTNRHNANRLITSGELAIPFYFDPDKVPRMPGYYVSTFKHREQSQVIARVRKWLIEQGANVQTDRMGKSRPLRRVKENRAKS